MSNGKIFAQLGHALFSVVHSFHKNKELYERWKKTELDIAIYEGTTEDIRSLTTVLHKHNVSYNKIIDAGRTQIPPGSNTVLIVGPCTLRGVNDLFSSLNVTSL